jgi:hypothetical protein
LTSSRTYLQKDKLVQRSRQHPFIDSWVLRLGGLPLHLEQENYRDFTTNSTYIKAFGELLEDIHADRGVPLKEAFRETYVTAPPLPMNYVARPEALTALRDALITDGCGRHIALTALKVSAPI